MTSSQPQSQEAIGQGEDWGKLARTSPPHSKGEVLKCGSSVAGSPDAVSREVRYLDVAMKSS